MLARVEVHLTSVDMVVIGSLSADHARIADDYERRLSRYVTLRVHELRAQPTRQGAEVVQRAEGARIIELLDRLARQAGGASMQVCALDLGGRQRSTQELVELWLDARNLVLLIGGTHGLEESVLKRADERVAFGRITLPHQMARVVATEQLYRCFRIARGEPYHF